ncbi:hypothetical protein ED860_20105, partial [Acinetobacter baumannii]
NAGAGSFKSQFKKADKSGARFPADLYVCAFGEPAELAALTLAEQLRSAIPGIRLLVKRRCR